MQDFLLVIVISNDGDSVPDLVVKKADPHHLIVKLESCLACQEVLLAGTAQLAMMDCQSGEVLVGSKGGLALGSWV